MSSKQELRTLMTGVRARLDPAPRTRQTHVACTLASDLALASGASVVGLYAAIGSELDPSAIARRLERAGVTVAYPAITGPGTMEFRPRRTGVPQPWIAHPTVTYASDPVASVRPGLLVVPGLAFDTVRQRLGYGGGYYDRYIGVDSEVMTIGIGFQNQLVHNIHVDKYDKRLGTVVLGDLIISESV